MDTLTDELVILCLTYLRATDFVNVRETNKAIFSAQRISTAIQRIMDSTPLLLSTTSPLKKQLSLTTRLYRPDSLFVFEVTSIMSALSAPQPLPGKGYWISSSWLANAKKYFEALTLPELAPNPKISPQKRRQAKIRQRRGSDCLPPWPAMNADLVCCHGQLALAKVPKARRRAIDTRSWFLLRRYYGQGPQFKCSTSFECGCCLNEEEEAKATAAERREVTILTRRGDYLPASLSALAVRKSGVPHHCLTTANLVAIVGDTSSDDEVMMAPVALQEELLYGSNTNSYDQVRPLIAGLYNLVPRDWLRQWRRYVKDPNLAALPPLDCTRLLCHAHGLLLVPPHVEEYLLGLKRSLLSGLGSYEGEVAEIVTADEWDELQKVLRLSGEYGVRFMIDDDVANGVSSTWSFSTPICHVCDPLSPKSVSSSVLSANGVMRPIHRATIIPTLT
jgi:hypothetical protein